MRIDNTSVMPAVNSRDIPQSQGAQPDVNFSSELQKQISVGETLPAGKHQVIQPKPGKETQDDEDQSATLPLLFMVPDEHLLSLSGINKTASAGAPDMPALQSASVVQSVAVEGGGAQYTGPMAEVTASDIPVLENAVLLASGSVQRAEPGQDDGVAADLHTTDEEAIQFKTSEPPHDQQLNMTESKRILLPSIGQGKEGGTTSFQQTHNGAVMVAKDAENAQVAGTGTAGMMQSHDACIKSVELMPFQSGQQAPLPQIGLTLPSASATFATGTSPAAAVLPQATGVLPMAVGTQAWQQSLGQQIACFTRDGVHHAELRLHPEELGVLQISLKLSNERAHLYFVTNNHQVRAALESAMPHLRTQLESSGIQLGQSSVGADTSSSSDSTHHGGALGQGRGEEATDEVNIPTTEDTIVRHGVTGYSRGISTFA